MANESKPKPKIVNKHKLPGKHRLPYDSIFKGKKQAEVEQEPIIKKEGFEIEIGSSKWDDKYDSEEQGRLNDLQKLIYDLVTEKTEINLKSNRRKPGRIDFNRYYSMLVENIDMSVHSHSDVFSMFAFYFSENLYNMFKLLDQRWGKIIVKELADKYGIRDVDDLEFL